MRDISNTKPYRVVLISVLAIVVFTVPVGFAQEEPTPVPDPPREEPAAAPEEPTPVPEPGPVEPPAEPATEPEEPAAAAEPAEAAPVHPAQHAPVTHCPNQGPRPGGHLRDADATGWPHENATV